MNKIKKIKYLTLVFVLVSLPLSCFGFGYSGDGEYRSEYLFPLGTFQELKLPIFSLNKTGEYVYEVDGYGSSYPHVYIVVKSEEKIAMWNVSALIEVENFEEGSKKIILRKKSRLNSHYSRMQKAGKILAETSDEWRGFYHYSDSPDPHINIKSVPFDAQSEPDKKKEFKFFHMGYHDVDIKGFTDYRVKVKDIESEITLII